MPYLKSNHEEATRIHEEYQAINDQRAFLKAARDFLQKQASPQEPPPAQQQLPPDGTQIISVPHLPGPIEVLQQLPQQQLPSPSTPSSIPPSVNESDPVSALFGHNPNALPSSIQQQRPDPPGFSQQPTTPPRHTSKPQPTAPESAQTPHYSISSLTPPPTHLPNNNTGSDEAMRLIEQDVRAMWSGDGAAKIDSVTTATAATTLSVSTILGGRHSALSPTPPRPSPSTNSSQILSHPEPKSSSPWSNRSSSPAGQGPPPGLITPPTAALNKERSTPTTMSNEASPLVPSTPSRPTTKSREAPAPKRLWTHFEEQPGRLLVDGYSGEDSSLSLPLGPRQELSAHWSIPLQYIQSHRPDASTIEEALQGLSVGLFRRGCTENGSQASIISKSVVGDGNRKYDLWKDPGSQSLKGRVPFYSPRTPGTVIFRMYWELEPVYTIAMGPSLHVRVLERDFEGSIRFILGNFKGRNNKSNPTSLSSLHSLSTVLETPLSRPNDSAARATWGCIQEARKVVEACFQEYTKTSAKLAALEETVEELKQQVEEEEQQKASAAETLNADDGDLQHDAEKVADTSESDLFLTLREKTRMLLSGRASCERKWRDSQLAFASILRSVVTNPSMPVLLRRDLITRMRLEYELWCPLSEEFAIPGENSQMWYGPLRDLPQKITAEEFRAYTRARVNMQMRTLSFEPNTLPMDSILFPRNPSSPNQRAMDPGAVGVFNSMSAAMGQYYQKLYANEDSVVRARELVRERTEQCVQECGAFPPGTRVVIFGSSANGFGSPKSDIDMCLHLPDGAREVEAETGAEAMSKLAECFEESGMKDVDACRLTARIPILKYFCPNPLANGESTEEDFIECDISMYNPLAVLNTGYLRVYAQLTPVTRVLASIIKRWAKARDINNPAGHTLSSYGYILMLLHFLTYHKRTGNGLVSPVAPASGNPEYRRQNAPQPTPILPNLHWMDPRWPKLPKGTPYCQIQSLPAQMMDHPFAQNKKVNTYYCRPSAQNDMALLQMLFPNQDLSLGILLASFFRFYAFEFDYKRHVVSLHSTASRGMVEREVKAELDGWRNYSAALTIEDPFETFYDVAHVLRGGYYHRIRREFAVAYSKIADAASGRPNSWNKGDLRSMTGDELIDWLCESVSTERDQTLL